MGYNLTIGNAVPEFSKDDGFLDAYWRAEAATADDAPTFPNDPMTGNSNQRYPSYSAWADFCDRTGLRDMFFDEEEGLLRPHPGCRLITESHHSRAAEALSAWRRKGGLPPGFAGLPRHDPETGAFGSPDDGKYDPILARLIWLEWWMRWALDNCETPAIENG